MFARSARISICLTMTVWVVHAQMPPAPAPQTQTPEAKPTESPAEPEGHGKRVRWQDLPKNILVDEKAILTSPVRINRDNGKWWLLFGGTTAALIAADRKISGALPDTGAQISVSRWTSRFGADYSIYPLAATFYLAGKLGNNPRARDTARIGIEALADAEITVNLIKFATQRPRPPDKDGHGRFWDGGDSFPSGHSIKSWALARVVAREFNQSKIVPPLAYGLAATVSISRFVGRRHFASDAFAGAALGWFIGDYVYRNRHSPSAKSKVVAWLGDNVNLQWPVRSRDELSRFRFDPAARQSFPPR